MKQIPVVANVTLENDQPKVQGVEQIVNPFDEFSIEEGISLKERFGGEVIALSYGPKENEKSLRQAISVGVDDAILVEQEAGHWSDTLRTSYILSKAIEKIGSVDLVILGKVATDGNTSQIGPSLAAWMNWPQLMCVKKIEDASDSITLWRIMSNSEQKVKSSLPAVISVVKEINEPRLPTLKGKMAAKKHQIQNWKCEDLSLEAPWTDDKEPALTIEKYFPKKNRPEGTLFKGEPEEVVAQFIEKIKEEKIL